MAPHTVKALLNAGYQVHVLDNLSTGNHSAVDSRASFKQLDVYDASALKLTWKKTRLTLFCIVQVRLLLAKVLKIQVNTSLPMLLV